MFGNVYLQLLHEMFSLVFVAVDVAGADCVVVAAEGVSN